VQGLGSELDEDNCFNKLFEVSYSRSSFSVDDERNSFLVLLEAEQLKGNKRLNKVVGSFEKVRIAQRKLINEKVCQMRFDLGQSDLERTIATNAVTIQTLRDQLSELTQRAEEKRSNEPDYAEMQDSKLRQMNDTVEGARKAAGILETDIIRVQAQMERNRVAISRLVHELQLDRRSTDGDLEEEEEEEQMAKFSSPSTPRTDGSTSQKPNSPRKTAIGLSKGSAAKEATEEDAEGLELAASTTRANRALRRMLRRREELREALREVQERLAGRKQELAALRAGERGVALQRVRKQVGIMETRVGHNSQRLQELQQGEQLRLLQEQQHQPASNPHQHQQPQLPRTTFSAVARQLPQWAADDDDPPVAADSVGLMGRVGGRGGSTGESFPAKSLHVVSRDNTSSRSSIKSLSARKGSSLNFPGLEITSTYTGSVHECHHSLSSKGLAEQSSSDPPPSVDSPQSRLCPLSPGSSRGFRMGDRRESTRLSDRTAPSLVGDGEGESGDNAQSLERLDPNQPSPAVANAGVASAAVVQQQQLSQMASIVERFHEHSRRCILSKTLSSLGSTTVSDILLPPSHAVPLSRAVKGPAKVLVGGVRAIDKDGGGEANRDGKLFPPARKGIVRKAPTTATPQHSHGPASLEVGPERVEKPPPPQVEEPSSTNEEAPLSLTEWDIEEEKQEELRQNYGITEAVHQMHALLAELVPEAALQPRQPNPNQNAKKVEFDDEDTSDWEEARDSERERAMGSVEFLRVSIGECMRALRTAYKDVRLGKAALKTAKQTCHNERLATQREKTRLLLSVDSCDYQWDLGTRLGDLQAQILSTQNRVANERHHAKQWVDKISKMERRNHRLSNLLT